MKRISKLAVIGLCFFAVSAAFIVGGNDKIAAPSVVERPASYILKGASSEQVAEAVLAAGGEVTHELGIIQSVANGTEYTLPGTNEDASAVDAVKRALMTVGLAKGK